MKEFLGRLDHKYLPVEWLEHDERLRVYAARAFRSKLEMMLADEVATLRRALHLHELDLLREKSGQVFFDSPEQVSSQVSISDGRPYQFTLTCAIS